MCTKSCLCFATMLKRPNILYINSKTYLTFQNWWGGSSNSLYVIMWFKAPSINCLGVEEFFLFLFKNVSQIFIQLNHYPLCVEQSHSIYVVFYINGLILEFSKSFLLYSMYQDIEKFYELHQQLSMDDLARWNKFDSYVKLCLKAKNGRLR